MLRTSWPHASWRKAQFGFPTNSTAVLLTFIAVLVLFTYHYRSLTFEHGNFGKRAAYSLRRNIDLVRNDPLEFWYHRYLRWHIEQRDKAHRGIVFLPVPAGLGDNMLGMLNLWGYSVLTGRLLLLDIAAPCPLENIIGDGAQRFVFRHGADNRIGPWVGANKYLSPNQPLSQNTSALISGPAPVVALHISVSTNPERAAAMFGYQGKVPPFTLEVRRAITQLLLEPNRVIAARKAELDARFGLCPVGGSCAPGCSEYIAVHARLGGVGEERFKRFRNMEGRYDDIADCFARNIARTAASHRNDRLKVYVATDVPRFRGIFKRVMKKRMPNAKVYTMDAEVAHFARSSDKSAQEDLQVENLLVSGARHIFAFRSGFSLVAYWRGNSTKFTTMRHGNCGVKGY